MVAKNTICSLQHSDTEENKRRIIGAHENSLDHRKPEKADAHGSLVARAIIF